ncbi:MAG: hypothetical protein M3Q68_03260, partial [Actinomycetota bacterium]|nr:hypothetical protein [Actinomycetota bacterium]
MHRLEQLSVDDLIACSGVFRGVAKDASSMEEAAQQITDYLRNSLVDGDDEKACPLVRFYKTHPFGRLEPELQAAAGHGLTGAIDDETRCLTLLG